MKDINLLVEEKDTPEKQSTFNKAFLVKLFIGIVIYACILTVTVFVPKIMIKTYESNIESMRKAMQSEEYVEMKRVKGLIVEEESLISKKSSAINLVQKNNYSIREVLNTVTNSVPEGVRVLNINYDSKLLNIALNADDPIAASEFIVNVGRIGFLSPNNSSQVVTIPSTDQSFNLRYSFTIVGKDGK